MVKVFGIGNRLMMDDGIAIAVLENLKDRLMTLDMEVTILETDIQFCFQRLNEDDFIIILDAVYSGREAGSISLCKLTEAIRSYGETSFQHDMSIFDLIQRYTKSIRGYLIGIEIGKIGFGCELSGDLKIVFNDICLNTERLLKEIVTEELLIGDGFSIMADASNVIDLLGIY